MAEDFKRREDSDLDPKEQESDDAVDLGALDEGESTGEQDREKVSLDLGSEEPVELAIEDQEKVDLSPTEGQLEKYLEVAKEKIEALSKEKKQWQDSQKRTEKELKKLRKANKAKRKK